MATASYAGSNATHGDSDEDGPVDDTATEQLKYGLAGLGVLLLLGGVAMAGAREYRLKGTKIAQIAGAAGVLGYAAGYMAGHSTGRAKGHAEGMYSQKQAMRRTLGM